MVPIDDRARLGHVEASKDVQERGLAAARWTENDDELRFEEVEVGAAQRVHVHLAHVIDLRELTCTKDGGRDLCPRLHWPIMTGDFADGIEGRKDRVFAHDT